MRSLERLPSYKNCLHGVFYLKYLASSEGARRPLHTPDNLSFGAKERLQRKQRTIYFPFETWKKPRSYSQIAQLRQTWESECGLFQLSNAHPHIRNNWTALTHLRFAGCGSSTIRSLEQCSLMKNWFYGGFSWNTLHRTKGRVAPFIPPTIFLLAQKKGCKENSEQSTSRLKLEKNHVHIPKSHSSDKRGNLNVAFSNFQMLIRIFATINLHLHIFALLDGSKATCKAWSDCSDMKNELYRNIAIETKQHAKHGAMVSHEKWITRGCEIARCPRCAISSLAQCYANSISQDKIVQIGYIAIERFIGVLLRTSPSQCTPRHQT